MKHVLSVPGTFAHDPEDSFLEQLLEAGEEFFFEQETQEEDGHMSLRRAARRTKASRVHKKRKQNVQFARWRAEKIARQHKKIQCRANEESPFTELKRKLKRIARQANIICHQLEGRYGLKRNRHAIKQKTVRYRRIKKTYDRAA